MTPESERLILRDWRDEDLAPFATLNADPRVMHFMPRCLTRPQSDRFVQWAQDQIGARGFGPWAVQLRGSDQFIGCVGLSVADFPARFTPCVEVLWRLRAESWGQGYATEAAAACLDFAFGKLAIPEVVAFTAVANERSRAVMRRLGMTHDAADDFDHPRLPAGHPLRGHVLYRSVRAAWRGVLKVPPPGD
jgi:RimJ/RimL family protein N-acetyltransferase